MATAVQIELQVDEKGAVSGVRNVDTALKGVTPTAQALNSTLERLNVTLDQMGKKGKKAASDTEKALASARREATEALHGTHLLTEEFDIHLPRAMQRIVAQSKIAQAALSALGPAMMGLGAIQIGAMVFTQLYDGAKKLYEKWLDVDGAIKKYNDEAAEAASKKFYENAGVEDLTADLKEANEQLDRLSDRRKLTANLWEGLQAREGGPFVVGGIGTGPGAPVGLGLGGDTLKINPNLGMTMGEAKTKGEAQATADATQLRLMEETHKKNLGLIVDEKVKTEAKLTGIAKERIARDAAYKTADENRRYRAQEDTKLAEIANRGKDPSDPKYLTVRPDAGATENTLAKQHADAEFQAHQTEQQRTDAQELRRIHEEALESGLHGSRLFAAQEAAAIRELEEKHIASAQAVADIHAKFHNEQMHRMEEEEHKIQEMRAQTQLVGLTGVSRVQQEEKNRVNAVFDPNSGLNPGQRLAEVNEIHKQTVQQIGELNKSFATRVDEITAQAANRELSGFNRIRADADNQIAALRRDFKDKGGKQSDLDRGIAGIKQSAGDQSVEKMREISDETGVIEAEARAKSLGGEKQKTAALDAEYRVRIGKFEEWRRKELEGVKQGSQEEAAINDAANRREVAAAQERDADMVEASKAAREKMAGEFDHMFKGLDHPLKYLEEMGDKVAGEAAAGLVQKVQQHGHGTPAPDGGSLFGNVLGDFGFGGKKHGGAPGVPAAAPGNPGAAAATSSVFSLNSAMIRVASASISFGGGMGMGGSAVPGAAGGGTNLLGGALPSSGFSSTSDLAVNGEGAGVSSGSSAPATHAGGGGLVGDAYRSVRHAFGGSTRGVGSAPSVSAATPSTPSAGAGMIGGAGDSSMAAAGNFTTGGGTPPPRGAGLVGAVNNMGKGISLYKQAESDFSGGSGSGGSGSSDAGGDTAETQADPLSGTLNSDGSFTSDSSGSGDSSQGPSTADRVMSGAQGAVGLYSAYQGNGGVGGALSGAMSGMELGMAVGGPIGAAIGAGVGALVGAIGFGGREKARVYDLKTVRPRLKNDTDSFQQGSMDYLSAYSDMESAQTDANHTISKLGPAANSYYQDTIKPEISTAEQKLSREAKAGRSASTFSAAQYDTGGAIDDFGDLATSPDHGLVHAQLGEFVVKPNAYQKNKSTLDALNSGASMEDVANSYRSTMQSRDARSGSQGGDRTAHLHFHSPDAKGIRDLFMNNAHHVRAALNSSYGSYGGQADA
jgi:hypothetical protein